MQCNMHFGRGPQLDAMFGGPGRAAPATAACTGWAVVDWAQRPLARGAYTHPSVMHPLHILYYNIHIYINIYIIYYNIY